MQETYSTNNIDSVLEYLLEFNKDIPIEYTGRYLIPAGGLQQMLDNFKGFHLNKVEVVKSELSVVQEEHKNDLDQLMEMI